MTNTIDLLESIGQDASLRHASSAHLAQILSKRDASDALKQAAASGDGSLLAQKLRGGKAHALNRAIQVQAVWLEDELPVRMHVRQRNDAAASPMQ